MLFSVCPVWLFLLFAGFVLARKDVDLSTCRKVAQVYAKRVGPADILPVSPISDAALTECSGTLKHTNETSCCNADMESKFLLASSDYLREHIRVSNTKLKARITRSLHLYQEHLRLSMQEAHNKTSDSLTNMYRIPKDAHKKPLDSFFHHLNLYLMGSSNVQLTDIIDDLFSGLFPAVFDYVLSDPAKLKHRGHDFHKCLQKHHSEIQPFGNVPKHLGKKLKCSFQRAKMFTESLIVMLSAINSTDNLVVHKDCKRAVTRLQFCSLCSGEVEARPCRGLCLNIMRGCLSGISEISSSWDDLVVDFQNLYLGMFKHSNAQELLLYLSGNITDAFLHALDDGPRVYTRVMSFCRESAKSVSESDMFKKFLPPEVLHTSHAGSRIQSIRKDITSLISQLEDSKGFLQRMADGLCRTAAIYDQEMQSDSCWNGSAVGRYMHEVPEANIIAQAKHNVEVKITLIPDQTLLHVKDTLVHMKRNLSMLYNEELMLSDQTYKTVVGSGGGYSAGRDVITDDEDFAYGNSGSGSGDGNDEGRDRVPGDKSTQTARPIGEGGRGHGGVSPGGGGGGSGSRPYDGRDKGSRGSSANAVTVSFTLLSVATLLARIEL